VWRPSPTRRAGPAIIGRVRKGRVMNNDVEIQAHRSSGLRMAWVLTAAGLRMQWIQASVENQTAIVEIDAARQQQPALAA
jgi:hypothetical protein